MIVTRFAPSPTGYLHVGGARTALFNWLFARHSGGKFILRIEDTDTKRNTPTAAKQVMNDLRWLGIEWDEGPQVGGANGPYFQSQRLETYNKYLEKLLNDGKAYYCFETSEELSALREEARAEKRGMVYSRPERYPSEKEVEQARREGRPVTVRFAMPQEGEIVVRDIVRGEVRFAAAEMGDFIIQKSDGFPTYHFACVVDDSLMGVTHVLRGQEHLMNTPGHQALQEAFGFDTPVYAHMSVTVSPDGGKLSKRERPKALLAAIKAAGTVDLEKLAAAGGIEAAEIESFIAGDSVPDASVIGGMAEYLGVHLPEINVVDFLKSGYLPETMVNFLSLLGWNPGDGREIMTANELVECFDLNRLTKTNSLFDRQKLVSFNTEYIRSLDKQRLLRHFKDYLKEAGSPVLQGDDNLLSKLLEINAGARTLEDIEKKSRFIFFENEAIEYDIKAAEKVLLKGDGLAILAEIGDKLAAMEDLSEENIEKMLRGLAEAKGVGLGKVAQPLRVAICGNTVSPPIFESVNILGRENTLARIGFTLKKFGSQGE